VTPLLMRRRTVAGETESVARTHRMAKHSVPRVS
jgi:hypothetical protein